jgi:hypothetical protein
MWLYPPVGRDLTLSPVSPYTVMSCPPDLNISFSLSYRSLELMSTIPTLGTTFLIYMVLLEVSGFSPKSHTYVEGEIVN